MGHGRLRLCRNALLCVLSACSVESSLLASIHHGLQATWTGGHDNGAAEGCKGLENTLSRTSEGAEWLPRPQAQSKDLAASRQAEKVCVVCCPVANDDPSTCQTW